MPTRDDCLQLDAQDPLAPLREAFELPAGVVYLDGNSLGPLPRRAAERAAQVVTQEWGEGLIRSWNSAGWFALPRRLGDRLAPLIGAGAGEVLVTDTTSVNLFKLRAAMLAHQHGRDPGRRVIVSERGNFPTDLHIAQGLARLLQQGHELRLVDRAEDIATALADDVAVLMLTQVDYRSGALHDMAALTRLAQPDLQLPPHVQEGRRAGAAVEMLVRAPDGQVHLGLSKVDGHRADRVRQVPQREGAVLVGRRGDRGQVGDRPGAVGHVGQADQGHVLVEGGHDV
jgi:hypothetical protein